MEFSLSFLPCLPQGAAPATQGVAVRTVTLTDEEHLYVLCRALRLLLSVLYSSAHLIFTST